MDPQTLDGHYIAGPQTGDDASAQSGKGVPFVLGQPAVCEQPEPCSKAAGQGQFPGKLGCPQIAFASRQSPPTTFRTAQGTRYDKLVHNPASMVRKYIATACGYMSGRPQGWTAVEGPALDDARI
jgi:hypothetical protein